MSPSKPQESKRFCLYLLSIMTLTHHAWANTLTNTVWTCHVTDKTQHAWSVTHRYQLTAKARAFEQCKKQSLAPSTCVLNSHGCESFTNGISNRPAWQCYALDYEANVWKSAMEEDQTSAALHAKQHCEEQSKKPDSCYVNLITCKNIHESKP